MLIRNSSVSLTQTLLVIISFTFISACSSIVKQTVTPFKSKAPKNICVISNPKVIHKEFLQVYMSELRAKGYTVDILTADANITDCQITSKYIAYWGWDLALYLSYAKFEVYLNGKKEAEAVYLVELPKVSNKFFDTKAKIKELVAQLFPD